MLFFNRDDLIIIYDKINFGKINKNMNIDIKNKKYTIYYQDSQLMKIRIILQH